MTAPVKQRIVWIDAFKAFLALSVLMFHTSGLMDTGDMPYSMKVLRNVIHAVNVPAFAFISGYIAYRPLRAGDSPGLMASKLGLRVRAYLVPACVFAVVLKGWGVVKTILSGQVGMYYFLCALANIFVIFYLIRMVFMKYGERAMLMAQVAVTILGSCALFAWHNSPAPDYLHWRETADLMLFFTLGVLTKALRHKLLPLADWRLVVVALLAFIVLAGFVAGEASAVLKVPKGMVRIAVSVIGVLAVSGCFYVARRCFERKRIRQICNYCGRRTLSMYVTHPVILAVFLELGTWPNRFTLLPIWAITAAACWALHDLIYKLPPLHALLFGQKRVV